MDDKIMLGFAAKAAKYVILDEMNSSGTLSIATPDGENYSHWNPANNGEQAMRLVVDLSLRLKVWNRGVGGKSRGTTECHLPGYPNVCARHDKFDNPHKATWWAITRARRNVSLPSPPSPRRLRVRMRGMRSS